MATTLKIDGYSIGVKGLKQQLEREYSVDMEAVIRRTKEKHSAPRKEGEMSKAEMEKQFTDLSSLLRNAM